MNKRLIDDLHREHVAHEQRMSCFRTRVRELVQARRTDVALQALAPGIEVFAGELASHIRAEDEELFPRCCSPVPIAEILL